MEGYKTALAVFLTYLLGGLVPEAELTGYVNELIIALGTVYGALRLVTTGPVGGKILMVWTFLKGLVKR